MTATRLSFAAAVALVVTSVLPAQTPSQAPVSATQVAAITNAVVQHHTATATRRDSLYIARGIPLPQELPEVRVVSSIGCGNNAQSPECSPLLTSTHRSQIARDIAERLGGVVIAPPEITPNVAPPPGEPRPGEPRPACSGRWELGHERLIIEWVALNGTDLLVRMVSMQQPVDPRCSAGGGAVTLVITKTGDTYRLSDVRDIVYY